VAEAAPVHHQGLQLVGCQLLNLHHLALAFDALQLLKLLLVKHEAVLFRGELVFKLVRQEAYALAEEIGDVEGHSALTELLEVDELHREGDGLDRFGRFAERILVFIFVFGAGACAGLLLVFAARLRGFVLEVRVEHVFQTQVIVP